MYESSQVLTHKRTEVEIKKEEEIREERKRRERLLQRMKNDSSCPSFPYSLMEVYISALKWVPGRNSIHEGGLTRLKKDDIARP